MVKRVVHNRICERPLVLASASPRRRELLAQVGVPATVLVSDVNEVGAEHADRPEEVCMYNARLKAAAVAEKAPDGSLVLAADTIVVLGGRILGKPGTPGEARAMLRDLSGRSHRVMTGFIVRGTSGQDAIEGVVTTEVVFKPLSDPEIEGYIATGEPFDKAGGYGVQKVGAFLVARVNGSYTNVVGLPLVEALQAIRRLGGPGPFCSEPVLPSESGR